MFSGSENLMHLSGTNHGSEEVIIKEEPLPQEEPDGESSSGEVQVAKRKKPVKGQYTQVQLQLAYEAVQNGMSLYRACKMYGVPRPTLQYRVKHKITDLVVKMGKKCFLSKSKELSMVGPLHALADAGFTITHCLIKVFAAEYVKVNIKQFPAGNPFLSGTPGKNWTVNFLKRHPNLAKRMSENWAQYGYTVISPEHVPVWFGCVSRYLERMGLQTVIQNRRQVFTMDEINLKRGKHDVTFTCFFGANAYGNLLPPMILYPDAIKIPRQRKQSEVKYVVTYHDTEVTAGNALYKWLSKVFHPWLVEEGIPRPVIIFIDGHRHQISYLSNQFCQQHHIVPVSLLPRNEYVPRPLNEKLFESIKILWREEMQRSGKSKFSNVDPMLQPVLNNLSNAEDMIRDGFFRSNMYPWNPEGYTAHDYRPKLVVVPKVRKNAKKAAPRRTIDPMMALFRRMFESRLSEQVLVEFQAHRHDEMWQGSVEHTSLFNVWRDLQNEIDDAEPEMDSMREGDELPVEPEFMTVQLEDSGECSVDMIKEEPTLDYDDL